MRTSLFFIALLLFFVSCSENDATKSTNAQTQPKSWSEIEAEAKGQTVQMMMWQGDPRINAYMNDFVKPTLREKHGIELQIGAGQGNVIVQTLLAEKQAGKAVSDLDLVWINGETFFQLRQINALYGPWTEQLPNAAAIRWESPFIGVDFQQAVEGYECPWGNVQMSIIYDSAKVAAPPRTRAELAEFVRTHPGVFTFDNHFTGLTFLKSLLIDIAGGKNALNGSFDEKKYQQYSAELWAYLREIRPYLWKKGRTFPEAVAPMHQMFGNGELWFTMSNNDAEVDNKIAQGGFPKTARAYIPSFGSIQNSHYLGIPSASAHKSAAMVVANFLISPAAQAQKMNPSVWGDGTVLNLEKLADADKKAFDTLPGRTYALPRALLDTNALQELAPEYMLRLAADFRTEILEK